MSRGVLLFTRDLRVHDNPALALAADRFDEVVPLFVLDEALLAESPNRTAFLVDSLRDLNQSLARLGAPLVLRRGRPAEQVRTVGADAVVVARDASPYAHRREERLRSAGFEVLTTPGISVHGPGELAPTGRDHYKVFSPYWRRWAQSEVRPAAPGTSRLAGPSLDSEPLPDPAPDSQELPSGGESAGLRRLEEWLAGGGLERYARHRNEPADDATSRLSPYLHLGCISPAEVVRRVLGRRHAEPFLRQLCWRDFHTQLLWANPRSQNESLSGAEPDWESDEDGLEAWKAGRTGYPLVDAAMRQLRREGWIHGRGRLVAASFLSKHLGVDWRLGERHFRRLLVDGDAANNSGNWQWAAGTGVDTRPYRILNPLLQAERHDPDSEYVRRYLPELTETGGDYPVPIVDHVEAVQRFRARAGRLRP
jgi:deoxyribodipyrimidine photo-lyase